MDATASLVGGVVAADSKGGYDACRAGSFAALGSRDRRAALEAAVVKENIARSGIILRWIHSKANLADPLTKPMAAEVLQECFDHGCQWVLVDDPEMKSSKKRDAEGIARLANTGVRAGDLPPC